MKVKTLLIILFLLFHAIFININYIDHYTELTYILIIICGLYLVLNVKKIAKKYQKINFFLFIFILTQILSSVYNQNLQGVIISIKTLEVFMVFELIASEKLVKESFNLIFYLLLFYIIINDFSLLVSGALLKYGYNLYYMLGNKFTIGLLHIELFLIYIQKTKFSNKNPFQIFIKAFLFIISVFISLKIDCSTTLICNFIAIVMLLIPQIIKEKLYNPKFIIIIFLFFSFVLILYSQVLQMQFVQHFVVDILKKDITLTGRMNIYKYIWPVLKERLILGYGYGTSYSILMPLLKAPNTQNGLFEYIFNYGLIVTIIMIIFIYKLIKEVNIKKEKNSFFPLLIFIFILLFMSCVEISINISLFIFLGLLITCLMIEKKEEDCKEEQ